MKFWPLIVSSEFRTLVTKDGCATGRARTFRGVEGVSRPRDAADYNDEEHTRSLPDGTSAAAIVRAGLAPTLAPENAVSLDLDTAHVATDTLGLLGAPPEEQGRRIAQMLVNRKIRDATFRRQVCDAYENTWQ